MSDVDAMVGWLREVWDADEQAARGATLGPWEFTDSIGDYGWTVRIGEPGNGVETEDSERGRFDAAHIARHGPRDTLARIDGERAVLAAHDQSGERWTGFPRADRHERYCIGDQQPAPCPTLRALASGYRHRAGWQQGWAP